MVTNGEKRELVRGLDHYAAMLEVFERYIGGLRIEAERLCDENERLMAENEKLRKIIEAEAFCQKYGKCHECVAYRPDTDRWCDQGTWLEELGIEVELWM